VKSNDVASAYATYRNAVCAEELSKLQVERARLLFAKGAIAKKDLEIAEETEESNFVTLDGTIQALRILGVTDFKKQPNGIVDIGIVDVYAPISGVIVEQNVTTGAGVKTLDNSPNLFTINNLDYVWVLCDVYENNLPFVRLGDYADVRLNAYPDKLYKGRISNIGPILDPTIRTAKVRLEMANPGYIMSIGMFATATFYAQEKETYATVPATAILHLHDRDWVYVPAGGNEFRRVEVKGGRTLAGAVQGVTGIKPGQKVVANALVLQITTEQ
jgi:cobalt-zinc-cadmium efflux system membrane fusion protein